MKESEPGFHENKIPKAESESIKPKRYPQVVTATQKLQTSQTDQTKEKVRIIYNDHKEELITSALW